MKYRAEVAALLLSVSVIIGSAQPPPERQGGGQDTQIRGYWIDPSTGLMWAGKDNGKDVSWHKAMKYCRDLRLAGYSDWRLATLGELKGIYDKNANAPGRDGQGASTWHVKGNLFLTGNQWSSSQRMDDRGKPSGYAWRFDFNEGRSFGGDELWFYTFKRALCVRGPEKKECSARPPLGAVGAVQRRGDNAAQNLLQGAAEHQYGQLEATGPPRR